MSAETEALRELIDAIRDAETDLRPLSAIIVAWMRNYTGPANWRSDPSSARLFAALQNAESCLAGQPALPMGDSLDQMGIS